MQHGPWRPVGDKTIVEDTNSSSAGHELPTDAASAQAMVGYFTPPWLPPQESGPRIGITGDFVVNEGLEKALSGNALDPFEAIRPWAERLALLVMTLDATFPGEDPKPWRPRIVTGPTTLSALPRAERTVVNLANNHVFDMGLSGFHALCHELQKQGIHWVGAGESPREAESPWKGQVSGNTIAIFSAVHPGCHPRAPLSSGAQVASLHSESWWNNIRSSIASGYATLVLVHGGIQGCRFPSVEAMTISRKLAETGVATVVWSHAHVVQGGERWSGVPIAYGLGNTYYPNLGANPEEPNWEPEYDRGLLLQLSLTDKGISGGSALAVHRTGLVLTLDSRPERVLRCEQEKLSAPLLSRFYPVRFRLIRFWEDIVRRTWRYFMRDGFCLQIRRINAARLRRLFKCIRNIRADAEDV